MADDRTDYTVYPEANEPHAISDLQDKIAQLEAELEHAYAANDSVCEIMVAALERRELQMLRREHDAIKRSLDDADYRVHCPVCFGTPDVVFDLIDHRDNCPYEAIERFQERHG